MKTFRLSHALAVWAALLAALALLSACDSPVATDTTDTGIAPKTDPTTSQRSHRWKMCGTPVEFVQTCPTCIFKKEQWELIYMTSDRPKDTARVIAVDTLTYCQTMGTFPDTARFLGLDAWLGDSAWFVIDDTIVRPFQFRTRMNPDSVGYKAWGEK